MTGRTLILSIALTAVAGCVSTSGVITGTSAPGGYVGTVAPDVEYKSLEGKQVGFNKVRQPIAIVAFVAPAGATCCWLEPRVVNLSNQLWDLPVTVAQFSEPTSKCPHGPGCVEVCNLHKGGVMALCDAQKLAWKAYGKPAPGTLILIGSDNKIVATGSLSNSGPLLAQAERLGQQQKESMPGGDRLGIY
jgi:hypothetical protein